MAFAQILHLVWAYIHLYTLLLLFSSSNLISRFLFPNGRNYAYVHFMLEKSKKNKISEPDQTVALHPLHDNGFTRPI